MGTGRDVIMVAVGAVITKLIDWIFKKADKSGARATRQKEARMAIARHMRRAGAAIDRLNISATNPNMPRLDEVKRVRALLAERDNLRDQLSHIGAPDLEVEVNDWHREADEELSFAEDYVSGDSGAPTRWRVDWPEWNRRWALAHQVKAKLLASVERIASALEK